MEFLVILTFFGLSAGAVAKIKGGSFVIWFLIGFSLPVLGTLAAVVAPGRRNELKRRCEECGAIVAFQDQVCMRCGTDLDFPTEALATRPGAKL